MLRAETKEEAFMYKNWKEKFT